jgi:transposase
MLRIDGVWLCTQPVDMRAGGDRLLAAVVAALGEARAHHGYLFANARGTRIKLLVHDGFGIWCAARRLHAGRFVWTHGAGPPALALSREQFDALVLGLPWQLLGEACVITRT